MVGMLKGYDISEKRQLAKIYERGQDPLWVFAPMMTNEYNSNKDIRSIRRYVGRLNIEEDDLP